MRAWIDRNLSRDAPHRLLAAYAELAYTQTHGLRCALAGSPFVGFAGHHVSDLTIGDGLNAWPDFLCAQDRAEDAAESPDLRIEQVTHPNALMTRFNEHESAVPTVDGVAITPRAVFEGAALQIQLDWVRSQLSEDAGLPTALRLLNAGFMDDTYLRTRHLVAKVLARAAWPARRCVLLTLSDLALWGSTHRDYGEGGEYDVAWEDLHPGYRFVRALRVLAEPRSNLAEPDLRDPARVTHVVCSELGWMTPIEMATNFLRNDAPETAGSPLARDALRDRRYRAAQARLTAPTVFIDAENEHEMHERFQLVLPFIVEQARVRMRDSSELYEVLALSTIAHLAPGILDGRLMRLFNEPRNASDPIHTAALQAYFGDRYEEYSQLLKPAPQPTPPPPPAIGMTTEADPLLALSEWLSQHGLNDFQRVVRTARTSGRKEEAVDWFVRQPIIVEAIQTLIELRRDVGVSSAPRTLANVLGEAIERSDASSLAELLEDCGLHSVARNVLQNVDDHSGDRSHKSEGHGSSQGV